MINPETYLSNIIVIVPTTSALLCAVVMGFSVRDSLTQNEIRQKYAALFFFLMNAATCGAIYLYEFYPALFLPLIPLCFASIYLFYISFYQVIIRLTSADNTERLSPLHYVPVVALFVVLALLQWVVLPRHEGWLTPILLVRHSIVAVVIVGYTIASFYRLYHYYIRANATGSLVYNSISWVALLIAFCCISSLCGIVCLYVPRAEFGTSPWSMFAAVTMLWMHIEISYHVVVHKYQLYLLTDNVQSRRHYYGEMNRQRFEQYIQQKKPYLNPNFRISDMVSEMDVNRTTLSQFVNQTYGVNFSRYINRLRLEKMQELQSMPGNLRKRLDELVKQAGFHDVKHYHRVRAQERNDRESEYLPTT
ncbi:MAG: hypothetical protein LBL97_00565 [Prevotellaceae bacterium]|jgi:AraC-like DNA-binding protein|nr:hypothetical protein [Prevotellaceae bacterium]